MSAYANLRATIENCLATRKKLESIAAEYQHTAQCVQSNRKKAIGLMEKLENIRVVNKQWVACMENIIRMDDVNFYANWMARTDRDSFFHIPQEALNAAYAEITALLRQEEAEKKKKEEELTERIRYVARGALMTKTQQIEDRLKALEKSDIEAEGSLHGLGKRIEQVCQSCREEFKRELQEVKEQMATELREAIARLEEKSTPRQQYQTRSATKRARVKEE